MAKKAKEIKDLTAEELSTTLRELKQEALNLRHQSRPPPDRPDPHRPDRSTKRLISSGNF
jgi:ribosomal protein L29